jgi:hypothetical protein
MANKKIRKFTGKKCRKESGEILLEKLIGKIKYFIKVILHGKIRKPEMEIAENRN